jgi:hypothetical protein
LDSDGTIAIKTVILNIHSLPNDTATTVSTAVMESIEKYNISNKIIAFLADNAPVNFGSIKSKKQTAGRLAEHVYLKCSMFS